MLSGSIPPVARTVGPAEGSLPRCEEPCPLPKHTPARQHAPAQLPHPLRRPLSISQRSPFPGRQGRHQTSGRLGIPAACGQAQGKRPDVGRSVACAQLRGAGHRGNLQERGPQQLALFLLDLCWHICRCLSPQRALPRAVSRPTVGAGALGVVAPGLTPQQAAISTRRALGEQSVKQMRAAWEPAPLLLREPLGQDQKHRNAAVPCLKTHPSFIAGCPLRSDEPVFKPGCQ